MVGILLSYLAPAIRMMSLRHLVQLRGRLVQFRGHLVQLSRWGDIFLPVQGSQNLAHLSAHLAQRTPDLGEARLAAASPKVVLD